MNIFGNKGHTIYGFENGTNRDDGVSVQGVCENLIF